MPQKYALVSIIIPLYNQSTYVTEAVESAMSQDFSPIEVIIINDGSTDKPEDIISQLVGKYPTITVINQENSGVSIACCKGLEVANGAFILRLDADDYIPPTYISKLYDCLKKEKENVAFSYCDAKYVGSREGVFKSRSYSKTQLVQENYIHVSGLVRMSAIKKIGYYNQNMTHGLEDWDFWLSLAESGFKGVYCQDTYLNYRIKDVQSRNHISVERYRAMRQQIYKNHPKIYRNPWFIILTNYWRIKKRLTDD